MVRQSKSFHVLTLGVLLMLVLAAGCGAPAGPAPQATPAGSSTSTGPTIGQPRAGGNLTVGVAAPIDTIDGTKTASMHTQGIIRQFTGALVRFGVGSEPAFVPDLAESWTVSDNQLAWTFKLKQGVKFTDGTPFNAAAVKANVDRWMNKDTQVYSRGNWGAMIGAEVIDDYTVKLNFSAPHPGLLEGLSFSASVFYSPKDIAAYPDKEFGTKLLSGTGPFKIKEFIPREKLVLERFDGYSGKRPYLDTITFRQIADQGALLAALEAGEIDVAFYIDVTQLSRVSADPKLQVLKAPATRSARFIMNYAVAPLNDVLVRKAIQAAIDREGLVNQIMEGYALLADSFMCQGCQDSAPAGLAKYDPEQAKTLLDQAGWKVGTDGIREKGGQKLRLTVDAPRGRWLRDAETAEAIAGFLKKVGVDTKLQISDFTTFFDRIRANDRNEKNQLAIMAWAYAHPSNVFSQLYVCKSIPPPLYNFAGYCNSDFEALYKQYSETTNHTTQVDLTAKMQKKLVDDAVEFPLYQVKFLVGASKKVHDIGFSPSETHRFDFTWVEQ